MAAVTWKNVGASNITGGEAGFDTAQKALAAGTGAFTDAANTLQGREIARYDQRTADAINNLKGITNLNDLATAKVGYGSPEGEAALGDIDINKFREALVGRDAQIRTERDIAAQDAIRGFDSGITLAPPGEATLAGQQAKIVDLRAQVNAIPNLTRPQKDALFKERQALIGFTPERTQELAYQQSTKVDPTTGQATVDPTALTKTLKGLGFGAEAIDSFIKAEKNLSGQTERENLVKAAATEQAKFDLDTARSQYGLANTNARLESMTDLDNRSNATEAVTLARTLGYPEHIINQATRTALEEEWWGEEAKLGIGNFTKEMDKLVAAGWSPKGLNTPTPATVVPTPVTPSVPQNSPNPIDREATALRNAQATSSIDTGAFDVTPADITANQQLLEKKIAKELTTSEVKKILAGTNAIERRRAAQEAGIDSGILGGYTEVDNFINKLRREAQKTTSK